MPAGRCHIICAKCGQVYRIVATDDPDQKIVAGYCYGCACEGAAEKEVPDLVPGGPALGTPAARENPSAERAPTPAAAPSLPRKTEDT